MSLKDFIIDKIDNIFKKKKNLIIIIHIKNIQELNIISSIFKLSNYTMNDIISSGKIYIDNKYNILTSNHIKMLFFDNYEIYLSELLIKYKLYQINL